MTMKSNHPLGILCFSPTKTTEKICRSIAAGMGSEEPVVVNITDPVLRGKIASGTESLPSRVTHWVVGAPVYLGKLPEQVIEFLHTLKIVSGAATAVVVYGNRDYGIALRQLVNLLSEIGFNVHTAGAFIGQHSYAKLIPIAVGRPDRKDLEQAFRFGQNSTKNTSVLSPDAVPVQLDMVSKSKKYSYPLRAVYKASQCTQCGKCAESCPVGIIEMETGNYLDKTMRKQCVGCMNCVNICNDDGRIMQPGPLMHWFLRNYLKKASSQRLEPVTFP